MFQNSEESFQTLMQVKSCQNLRLEDDPNIKSCPEIEIPH